MSYQDRVAIGAWDLGGNNVPEILPDPLDTKSLEMDHVLRTISPSTLHLDPDLINPRRSTALTPILPIFPVNLHYNTFHYAASNWNWRPGRGYKFVSARHQAAAGPLQPN